MPPKLAKKLGGKRGGGGVKKLVVRNLRAAPSLPADFGARTWTRLARTVDAVHRGAPVADSLEQLYGAVEAACTAGYATHGPL